MNGWMGQILEVNLTTGKITQFPTAPYAEKYLGGRGIAAALYWEKVKPETRPYDPENHLIFMSGLMVGTGAQGANQMSVISKSPLTVPEGFCYGSLTGFVSAELKKAGFDGVVVTGCASKPVYIYIEDGKAEIRDASSLWGTNGYEAGAELEKIHGEKTRFIAIGLAGENMVRHALALASHDCTVSAGFGSVMGSKKLKAIAIRGTGKIHVADPAKLQELNRYVYGFAKRVRLVIPPRIEFSPQAKLLEVIGKGRCYLCGMECVAAQYRYGGKLEGHRKCQSVEYYLPWYYKKFDEPIETFFDSAIIANDYGFDSWEMLSIVDWLYDAYQGGALSEEDSGLPLSQIGTREFLIKLYNSMVRREGIGAILAEGLYRAKNNVPEASRKYFRQTLAPIGQNYAFSPRAYVIMSLFYPPEPRVCHLNYHDICFAHVGWTNERRKPGSTGVTSEMVRDIARRFWGSEKAADFTGYEGQALAAKNIQNRTYLKEELGLCDWVYPVAYSMATDDHFGDPDVEAKICNAVTGLPMEGLELYGERAFNLHRMILLREGRKTPEADYPAEFNFTEPFKGRGPAGLMVPGPDGKATDVTGNKLDRAKFKAMLREYYTLRGWDPDTGIPKQETLKKLGIGELI